MPLRTGHAGADDFFRAEFGGGELAKRLWRGGLRANAGGYYLQGTTHKLIAEVSEGLDLMGGESPASALVDTLETAWNDAGRLRRACVPLTSADTGEMHFDAMSLIKVLLSIDLFQPALMRCIVNKISEFGEDTNVSNALAPLLLSQLKWLDFIADSTALCENLLAIVPIVSPQMQKSVVESLPEILDDSTRDVAVKELVRILQESPSMMGSVVDALGAFGVAEDCVQEVNGVVLATLAAANRDMLPASLRYLIRTAPSTLLGGTVDAIRSTLALAGLGPGPGRLCFDAVRTSFRISKAVADHAVKVLRKLERPSDHKPADFWIILALLDSPPHRKSAESLFCKKAAARSFSTTLLDAALAPFVNAFTDLGDAVISLASICLKAAHFSARETGISLYAMLFRLFNQGSIRRNIVASLLEHTGCRRAHEIDAALDALVRIARESEHSRALLPHSASVHGLLDFLEAFSDSHLRQIWMLLAVLCRSALIQSSKRGKAGNGRNCHTADLKGTEGEDDYEETDAYEEERDLFANANESELAMLEIVIRKELTHADSSYRRVGVLGACAMIKNVGVCGGDKFFKLLLDSTRTKPCSQALAFDELAQTLPEGECASVGTVATIFETVSASFEAAFLADATTSEDDFSDDDLPASILWANFDGPDVEVCIPVYRLIVAQRGSGGGPRDVVRSLAPSLRLLCTLTALRDKGSLEEIDALIGAPIRLPDIFNPVQFVNLSFAAKKLVLLSIFSAHCWLVELINGFATQRSKELRAKCIKRVENLIELEHMLTAVVGKFSSWTEVLFDAYHTVEYLSANVVQAESGTHRARKATSSGFSNEGDSQSANKRRTAWRTCARKLNPQSLALLEVTSPVTWTCTDVGTEVEGDIKCESLAKTKTESTEIGPCSLKYLLSELLLLIETTFTQDLECTTPLSTVVVHSGNTTSLKTTAGQGIRIRGASDDSVCSQGLLKSLKPALLALAPQLKRCITRGSPNPGSSQTSLADGDQDIELFCEGAILCLKCLVGLFSSCMLRGISQQELLFDILASLRFDGQPPVAPSNPLCDKDVYLAARISFEQLMGEFDKLCQSSEGTSKDEVCGDIAGDGCGENEVFESFGIEGSASFLAVLDAVYSLCSERDQFSHGPRLSRAAERIMERQWASGLLRIKRIQRLLGGILYVYMQRSEDPLRKVIDTRNALMTFSQKQMELRNETIDSQQAAENEKKRIGPNSNVEVQQWGTLVSHTHQTYCASVFEQYVSLFKRFKPNTMDNSDEALNILSTYITDSMPLYDLARRNDKVLGSAMRAGRAFVEAFIQNSLPFLHSQFPRSRRRVLRLLRSQQKATRVLQVFCAHSKATRDTSLTAHVPPLRKALELLLYRVKALMQSHNASGAYSLGNLKHRDINGHVVGSQNPYADNDGTEADEDEQSSDAENAGDTTNDATAGGSRRSRNGPGSRSSAKFSYSHDRRAQSGKGPKKTRKNTAGDDDVVEDEHLNLLDGDVAASSSEHDESPPAKKPRRRIGENEAWQLIDNEAREASALEELEENDDLDGFIAATDEDEDES